jgi:hypothetical protein
MKRVHPIGDEQKKKSPSNSQGREKSSPLVDPSVAPSEGSLTPSLALELLGLWELMDEPSRADLLTMTRDRVASS